MSNRTAGVAAALLVVLSAVVLTGCTTPVPHTVETPVAVAAEQTPSSPPSPASTPECRPENADVLPGEPLDVGLFAGMVDRGPREGANGTVAYASDGTLASYLVAPDDHTEAIIDRLCVSAYPFAALNAVRRGTLYSTDPTSQAYLTPLYAGDTLNLSPHMITSVGDVDGEVRAYETTFILPPQN
ncbi:hypothetical protein [Microbacterium sp. SA39]|uniref:hypothetical protein n=1 Tax=Microbacterium sp. SA39 TaxID=1263625 RepID=UPI0005F9E791|nr:hypothetical protein [Microbacterium sp. SA39]KJQ54649.1 hypothetical protein RS85_01378 [Microbacterium sp. SA39]